MATKKYKGFKVISKPVQMIFFMVPLCMWFEPHPPPPSTTYEKEIINKKIPKIR